MFKKLLPVIAGMSTVRRYSMVALTRDESVLEHSGMVALTCLMICRRLELPDDDVGIVLTRALLHDLDEIVHGDVARPTKHHSPQTRALFANLSDKALRKLEVHLGLSFHSDVVSAKAGELGLIVALADVLAVVYKFWDEMLVRGNLSMINQARNVRPQLVKLNKKFKASNFNNKDFISEVIREAMDVANVAVAASNTNSNYHIEEVLTDED